MLGKREAWALHLLLCALPKRAEVKSQGDWRIPRCMPTDRVSRVGDGRGSPYRDRCLCMCVCVHIYIYVRMLLPACAQNTCLCASLFGQPPFSFKKRSCRGLSAQSIWNFLLMFTALWESFEGDSPIIRQHLNTLTSMSHRPQLKDIYSKNASDPYWVVCQSGAQKAVMIYKKPESFFF